MLVISFVVLFLSILRADWYLDKLITDLPAVLQSRIKLRGKFIDHLKLIT